MKMIRQELEKENWGSNAIGAWKEEKAGDGHLRATRVIGEQLDPNNSNTRKSENKCLQLWLYYEKNIIIIITMYN